MTDNTETQTTASNRPEFAAFHEKKTPSGKNYETRIGVAWAHKDGNGFNLQLDLLPPDGKAKLRRISEKSE